MVQAPLPARLHAQQPVRLAYLRQGKAAGFDLLFWCVAAAGDVAKLEQLVSGAAAVVTEKRMSVQGGPSQGRDRIASHECPSTERQVSFSRELVRALAHCAHQLAAKRHLPPLTFRIGTRRRGRCNRRIEAREANFAPTHASAKRR